MTQASVRFGLALAAILVASTASSAAVSSDDELKQYAVHINRTPRQAWPGYGIYLGNGLVITAAHVPANVAETKPHVVIAGEDLPAALVRQGSLDDVDLTLLSDRRSQASGAFADAPDAALQKAILRRRSRCRRHPEGVAPSHVLPTALIPRDLRGRFDTAIGDVATTGNSGSGVFDAGNQCLLGIISRKISVGQRRTGLGPSPVHSVDIAKYFVPASVIKGFIPADVTF